jgi:hypothetical protein
MSDWTWEYVPDAANVVGGLTQAQTGQVESLAFRIADAVSVRRIGTPIQRDRSGVQSEELRRGACDDLVPRGLPEDVVLIVRVQHFELPDPAG